MIDGIVHAAGEDPSDPIGIMLIAALLRDDFPWLYETGMEAYRALRDGDARTARESLMRFRQMLRLTSRGPLMDEFIMSSKESHMMLEELEMLVDSMTSRFLEREEGKRVPESNE